MISHFKILNLITFAKMLYPNKATFKASRGQSLFKPLQKYMLSRVKETEKLDLWEDRSLELTYPYSLVGTMPKSSSSDTISLKLPIAV